MTKYNKRQLIVYISCFFWCLFFGLLAIENNFFLIFLFTSFFAHGLYLIHSKNFKCPRCNKDVYFNPINFFGTRIWIVTLRHPKNCSKCGYKLD